MGAKILLLTEDTQNMAKLEMCLSRHAHEILPAQRLAGASDLLDGDSTIDLVLSDLILSWGESFDLLKKIRADHLRNRLPFIFLCGSESQLTEPLRTAAKIHGADKFLFMDQFDAHRFLLEIEALLPEQVSAPLPQPPLEETDIHPEMQR